LYPQTKKKWNRGFPEICHCSLFQSVLWVVAMLFSSVMTSVPTLANVTTSTWRTVHTSFGNITNHLSAYFYLARFNQSSRWWQYSLHTFNEMCSSCLQRSSWLNLTNDSYHVEGSCYLICWYEIISSLLFVAGGLCIVAIMISRVCDQTSVNHPFYYIYYYYGTSTKARIKWHTNEILNPITDTIPNLQATSHPLQSYFHRQITYSQCWACCCFRCCCCCCCCRGRACCCWQWLAEQLRIAY